MPPSLTESASRIARSALPLETLEFGPWAGSMRSVPRDQVPRDHLHDGNDVLYLPNSGAWKRRGGQVQRFDTFGAATGHLPAKWGARARQMEEFLSESVSDGVPTLATLATKETVVSGLDDGRFSTLWWRDQVNDAHRTLGDDYNVLSYPSPGTTQTYRFIPLWYDSGAGGITRGASEFLRRFFLSGSRRFERVGRWWYFPSLFGTPSRWLGTSAKAASQTLTISSDITTPDTGGWESIGLPTNTECVATNDGATSYISSAQAIVGTYSIDMGLSGALLDGGSITITFVARRTAALAADTGLVFTLVNSAGVRSAPGSNGGTFADPDGTLTTSFVTYTVTITGAFAGATGQTANSLRITHSFGSNPGARLDITHITLSSGTASPMASYLVPSGPLPPLHAGTLAKGALLAGTNYYPDGLNGDGAGAWIAVGAATLYEAIDDTTNNDADYIRNKNANSICGFTLQTPTTVPTAGDQVTLRVRAAPIFVTSGFRLTIYVRDGGSTHASTQLIFSSGAGFADYALALTDAQIAAITAIDATWASVEVRFETSSMDVFEQCWISRAYLEVVPAAATAQGGWLGKHRFYHAVAFRFEDGSVWAPSEPRAPNDVLTSGYCLFTVDSANPDAHYDKVVWSNLPIGPYGTVGRLLLRTPKIDSTLDDTLLLNPRDLRVVTEIKDNTTTSYDDYYADDLALYLDADRLFIHFDHLMPPRARYIAAGDMRVLHGYGGPSPCAVMLAPVGRTTDYDLNLADAADAAYTANGSYMRLLNDGTGTDYLELWQTDNTSSVALLQLSLATYDTLQKLVDRINATSVASADALQWRAALLPGANPSASPRDHLTPHARVIASVVKASNTTLSKAAGGLAKVPVGAMVTGTGIPAGAYVTRIDSDTQLTISAAATDSATNTLTFAVSMGDSPTVASATGGWQRVIAGSLPGFLYYNNDYLDQFPLDKNAVWLTSASPGMARSAANNFHGKFSGKHTPPTDVGIVMGAYPVDNGFVVPCSKKRCAIRNTRDRGTGLDEDYRIFIAEDSAGCCSWASVAAGNRCGIYASPDGIVAADLYDDFLLSKAIYRASPNRGDFDAELPASIAATAADNDSAYLYARIARKALWVNYRNDAAETHPSRQVVYDFSQGDESGLKQLRRPDGRPWGWSLELVRAFSVMAEGRRSDGRHLYGWNDQNAGSAGDGRVDEFETGDTDNGTAISAAANTGWLKDPDGRQLSLQEATVEHSAPTGSAGTLVIHRSYSDATSSLTLAASATDPMREVKLFPQAARVGSAGYYLAYLQASGAARELRKLWLRLKRLPAYK